MNIHPPMRAAAALAALGALSALAALPAAAQTAITGFARSDQSDVSGVALTSADLLGFEPGTVKTFNCPTAWGVRTTSDALLGELAAPGGGGTVSSVDADLRELLDDGPGAGDAGQRLAAALGQNNSAEARRLARGLAPRLRGLLAAGSRMDPAHPGELAATRLTASVSHFNRFVTASSPEFLRSPPAEMTALHRILGRLVQAAAENEGRVADASSAASAGGLACAPPALVVTPPPVIVAPLAVGMCRLVGGWPREITAQVDVATNDTTYNGQPLAVAFPADEHAAAQAFVVRDEAVMLNGRRYVKYSSPRVLGPQDVTRAGEYMGLPVFVQAGTTGTPVVLYLPLRPACEFQPYELHVKTGGVRGE